jgi:hypothetical protein
MDPAVEDETRPSMEARQGGVAWTYQLPASVMGRILVYSGSEPGQPLLRALDRSPVPPGRISLDNPLQFAEQI